MKRSLAYDLLSPVRQQLVLTLKKRGQCDMESLATELFLSLGAVRQNLSGLTAQGVVRYTIVRSGPGRPRHIYQLTSDGQRIFPDFYDDIAVAFATVIEEEGQEVTYRLFNRAAEVLFAGLIARTEGQHAGQRMREIIRTLTDYGYLPDSRQVEPGTDEIVVGHCPILALARRYPQICDSELRCLQTAAGAANLTRDRHGAAGAGGCTFTFRQN